MRVKSPLRVELTAEERAELERRSRALGEPYRDVVRARAILKFITEWKATAHPFAWTLRSFAKILAKIDAALAKAA